MAERTVELDQSMRGEQDQVLRNAVERAERAEAELSRLKQQTGPDSGGPDASEQARANQAAGRSATPGTMDRSHESSMPDSAGHAAGEPQTTGVAALREDSMMAHLLDSLGRGDDIGHYGRLVFAMVARHFLPEDDVVSELTKDRDFSEDQARQMLVQVEGRDYSPPRRERILEWQAEQTFPIIPEPQDPDCGNVYKTLRFPKQTYEHIGHYQDEKAEVR